MGKSSKKNKVILAPPLPPEVDDDDIVISDDDIDFVEKNKEHVRNIVGLDRGAIDKVVTRVADHDDDKVELLYEERERKRRAAEALNPRSGDGLEVDRVDALPVKTLDGEVVFRTGKIMHQALSPVLFVFELLNEEGRLSLV
jgi:nucleolar complex protein 3